MSSVACPFPIKPLDLSDLEWKQSDKEMAIRSLFVLLISYFCYPCTRIVVPHITDAIQDWVTKVSGEPVENETKADVCIIEVSENEQYIIFFNFFKL